MPVTTLMNDANNAGTLLPCPFCGSEAEIERLGDRRRSTIYQCTSCGCSLETGEEWGHGKQWNERAALSTPNAPVEQREAVARAGVLNVAAFQTNHDKESLARLLFLLDEQPNSGAGIRMNCSWQHLKSWNRAQYERLADAILAVRPDEAAIRKDEREKQREIDAKIADAMPQLLPMSPKHVRGLRGSDVASAIRNGGKQP